MLMITIPRPRQPKDCQEYYERCDLEPRFALLSHLRSSFGVHGIFLEVRGGKKGRFGVHGGLLGGHGRLMYGLCWASVAYVMAGDSFSLVVKRNDELMAFSG